jgi:hypothetical protein
VGIEIAGEDYGGADGTGFVEGLEPGASLIAGSANMAALDARGMFDEHAGDLRGCAAEGILFQCCLLDDFFRRDHRCSSGLDCGMQRLLMNRYFANEGRANLCGRMARAGGDFLGLVYAGWERCADFGVRKERGGPILKAMANHQDAEITEIVVVLNPATEDYTSAVEKLKAAGVEIFSTDEENDVIEGAIESSKLEAIKQIACVNYLRTVSTYIADYPPGDPRDKDGPEEE